MVVPVSPFGWLMRQWRANPDPTLYARQYAARQPVESDVESGRAWDAALMDGKLHALAVTASSYTAGKHITFYQSEADIEPWVRTQRVAIRSQIGVEHLLASSGDFP